MRDETQRTIFPECKFYFHYFLIVLINGFLMTFQGLTSYCWKVNNLLTCNLNRVYNQGTRCRKSIF